TRLQVAANHWYKVKGGTRLQVAANHWYKVKGGRMAGQWESATCTRCQEITEVPDAFLEDSRWHYCQSLDKYYWRLEADVAK
nr:hypothetical protein [Tanacetum cinerariifolium]